jgi:hypothetical protein
MLILGSILFGWYLMVPPNDPTAPLSKWTRVAVYGSARDCKSKRYSNISQAKNSDASAEAVQKARNSKCVPSDALK